MGELQLVGVAAIWIASKFEEIYPPELSDFLYMTENAYSAKQVIAMETHVLVALSFVICAPTVLNFLAPQQQLHPRSEAHGHLVEYVLELALLDIELQSRHAPSQLVVAAYALADERFSDEELVLTDPLLISSHEKQLAADLHEMVKNAPAKHQRLQLQSTTLRRFSQ